MWIKDKNTDAGYFPSNSYFPFRFRINQVPFIRGNFILFNSVFPWRERFFENDKFPFNHSSISDIFYCNNHFILWETYNWILQTKDIKLLQQIPKKRQSFLLVAYMNGWTHVTWDVIYVIHRTQRFETFNISVGRILAGPLIGHPVVNLVAKILTTFQVCIMFTAG